MKLVGGRLTVCTAWILTVAGTLERQSLLQSTNHMHERMVGSDSMDQAGTLLTQLEEAIGHRVSGKTTQRLDPVITSAMNTQFGLLEAELLKEKVEQQALATASNNGIGACNSQKENSFSAAGSGVDALLVLATSAQTTHSGCRAAEQLNIGSQTTDCQAYYLQATSAHNTAPTCSCAYTASGTVDSQSGADAVETCFQEHQTWLTSHANIVTKKSTCETSLATATSKTVLCNAAQTVHESNVCSYKQKVSDTCGTFVTCLAPAGQETLVNQRVATLAELAQLSASQKGVYKAIKTAKCFLDLLEQPAAPTQIHVKACTDLVVDDSHLTLSYPVKEEPGTCDVSPASPRPGEEAWAVAKYQSQDWASLVQPVTACAASTPTPPMCSGYSCPNGMKLKAGADGVEGSDAATCCESETTYPGQGTWFLEKNSCTNACKAQGKTCNQALMAEIAGDIPKMNAGMTEALAHNPAYTKEQAGRTNIGIVDNAIRGSTMGCQNKWAPNEKGTVNGILYEYFYLPNHYGCVKGDIQCDANTGYHACSCI